MCGLRLGLFIVKVADCDAIRASCPVESWAATAQVYRSFSTRAFQRARNPGDLTIPRNARLLRWPRGAFGQKVLSMMVTSPANGQRGSVKVERRRYAASKVDRAGLCWSFSSQRRDWSSMRREVHFSRARIDSRTLLASSPLMSRSLAGVNIQRAGSGGEDCGRIMTRSWWTVRRNSSSRATLWSLWML